MRTTAALLISLTVGFSAPGGAQSTRPAIQMGQPLGATNQEGRFIPLSPNVKVYGSFRFTESCTFDRERNLIVVMNQGVKQDLQPNDGYVSLIHPDGTVHTSKWIGASREGLTLNDPYGSAISNGVLYTVDTGYLRSFDLKTGQPLRSIEVTGATFLNGVAVADDGTAYVSNTPKEYRVFRVTKDGQVSVFLEGEPLNMPNGLAIDGDGNIVVVNVGDNAVLTFSRDGKLLNTEHTVEGGNDGLVITEDGTKYVSSVRYGSISRIRPGRPAEIIASGIPSAASMCYDSIQRQLIIPMNSNDAVAFVALD
jgi:invasion protein IalB